MSTSFQGDRSYFEAPSSPHPAVLQDHVPESSHSSTGEVVPCSAYLKRLARERCARARMEEVMPSVASSHSSESKARVTRLKERIKRVYSETNGNPADGRWAFISGLLRLHCTRGSRHWLGVNLDAQPPEFPKHLSTFPKTSGEWQELERKIKGGEEVRSKVQRWITTAEFEPLDPEITVIQDQEETSQLRDSSTARGKPAHTSMAQTTLKATSNVTHPLSGGLKFGFNVVKRSNAVIKEAPKFSKPPASPPIRMDPDPVSEENNNLPIDESPQPPVRILPSIADILENNYSPLSFSASQIVTSTQAGNQFQKPVPSYKPSVEVSVSRDQVQEPKITHPEGESAPVSQKRGRSPPLEEPKAKKARIGVDEDDQISYPLPPEAIETPTLSPPKNLPRLTDLLATTPRSKLSTPKKTVSRSHADVPQPIQGSGVVVQLETSAIPSEPQMKDVSSVLNADNNFTARIPGLVSPPESPMKNASSALNVENNSTACIPDLVSGSSPLKTPPPDSPNAPNSGNGASVAGKVMSEAPQPVVESTPEPDSQSVDGAPLIEEALMVHESRPPTPISPKSQKNQSLRSPSVSSELWASGIEATTYNFYGLDTFDPSPAKSLSSLAVSDSESDISDERTQGKASIQRRFHPTEFNPQFTSTQKPGLDDNIASNGMLDGRPRTASETLDWGNDRPHLTSQLQAEVNSQVDEFDKFMEADLGYDLVVPGL